jgi:hypothetical protein
MRIDDQDVPLDTDPKTGLIRVAVNPGTHRVNLSWADLPDERTGRWISISTLGLLLLSAFFRAARLRTRWQAAPQAYGR